MIHRHPRSSACRNCGSASPGNFCPQCGQDTSLHPPSLWEFAHEFLTHYVAIEGPLWHTLRLLVLRPGELTREFLAGRRRRYIPPLRLYLTVSFLFFAFSQVVGDTHFETGPGVDRDKAIAQAREKLKDSRIDIELVDPTKPGDLARLKGRRGIADCLQPGNSCNRFERLIARPVSRVQADPQYGEHFQERLQHDVPYAMFLALPVFALLTRLAYRRRGLYFGEHIVFALHVHAFWFLLSLLMLPLPDAVSDWSGLAIPAYGIWAMHRVFGGRWWPTILRALFVGFLYLVAISLGAALLTTLVFLLS